MIINKIQDYNKMNKKCYNNNMNNFWPKVTAQKKSLSILENKVSKSRVKKRKKKNKITIDTKVRKKICHSDYFNIKL